jgi:uncharacterized protein YebE (UPF0316 family)
MIMFNEAFLQSDFFNWVVLPLLIFIARLSDVSLGTMRHILISKGMKNVVPFLGFIEVLIWLFAIGQAIRNLNNVACYIGFAAGFAMGTYVGIQIEEKLALGMQLLRIITQGNCEKIIRDLNQADIGVTILDGQGAKGPVKLLFSVINRKDLPMVVEIIKKSNPDTFYSVEDVRTISHGVFPKRTGSLLSDGEMFLRKIYSQVRK